MKGVIVVIFQRMAVNSNKLIWVYWCFTSHATIFPSYMSRHRCAGEKEGILLCTCRSVCRYVRRSVGMSVSLNLVQLKTQERFSPEASNLVDK